MASAENTVRGGGRAPVIAPGHTFASVTDKISAIALTTSTKRSKLSGVLDLNPSVHEPIGIQINMRMYLAVRFIT